MMKRFNERQWRDCDGDWFSTGMEETSNGKWCLFSEVEKQNELLKEMTEALDKAIRSVSELIGYSRGVDGLHLNGDVATWESLRTGGCYESWLIEFDEAASFLQKYHEQEKNQCGK